MGGGEGPGVRNKMTFLVLVLPDRDQKPDRLGDVRGRGRLQVEDGRSIGQKAGQNKKKKGLCPKRKAPQDGSR